MVYKLEIRNIINECLQIMRQRNLKNVSEPPQLIHFQLSPMTIIIAICLIFMTLTQCPENCLTCSNSANCTSCVTQTNLIIVTPSLGCLPCPVRCQKCASQLTSNQCIACSQGYYLDPYLQTCARCKSPNCLQCNEYFPLQCQSCQPTYFLEESTSSCKFCALEYNWARTCKENFIITCQDGYFTANGQACFRCDQTGGCRTCVSSTVCSQCFQGFYLVSGKCMSCDISCRTCNTNTSCTSCPRGFRLNTLSRCQACSTANCASCSIQDICQQCSTQYYLQTSNRTCILLEASKSVQNCLRYASNFNNSITGTYAGTAILCRTCANGSYLNLETNTCQGCSLLCENCIGMYRSSKCLSCNSVYARLIDSVNGVCGTKLYTSEGQKAVYRNNRNDAGIYVRNGKIVNITEGVLKCPGGQLAGEVGLNLTNVVGYQYKVYVKLLIQTSSLPPFNISVSLNSRQIALQSISTVTDCNTVKIANFSFSFSAQSLTSNFSNSTFPINPTQPNQLTFKSSQPQSLLIDIREIVILVKQCHESCALCQNYQTCIQCKVDSQYIEEQSCVESCGNGYFFYLSKKICLLECPKETFPLINSATWTCQLCNSSCSSCLSAKVCTSCLAGFYHYQGQCLTACPQAYFANNLFRKCQKCITPCQTCTSTRQCLSCQVGFYFGLNNTCLGECPDGYFGDFATMECKACKEPCSKCKSESLCLGCTVVSKMSYYGFQCLNTCPSQYFGTLNTLNQSACQFCSFPCQQCSKSPTTCTRCITGFLLSTNNTCLSTCPAQYYSSITFSMCIQCQSPCKNCVNSEKFCTSCLEGYLLMGNKCVAVCQSGYFRAGDTECRVCKAQCESCVSKDNCTSCAEDYYLQGNDCLTECIDGYYKTLGLNNQRICAKCNSNCLRCFGQANYCLSCPTNYFLQPDNTCNSICGPKQLTPGCAPCESPCYSCSVSTTNCTSCLNSYFFAQKTNQCVTQCYFGQYKFVEKGFGYCRPCVAPCTNCESLSLCYSCTKLNGTSFYLQSHSPTKKICVANCGLYQYKDDSRLICMKCVQPCLTCSNATFCLSCINGLLVNGTCSSKIDGCPIGSYRIQTVQKLSAELNTTVSTCLLCPSQCSSCKSQTICTGCIRDFYFYGQSCLDYCPSGSAPIKQLRKCILCQYPCAQCYGTSSNCTKCSQILLNSSTVACPQDRKFGSICIKYYITKGQCTPQCPSTSYPKGDQCLACLKPCQTCISQTVCTSCIDKFFMLQNSCYSTCPSEYYAQPLTEQCQKCSYPCKSCRNQNQCLSCRQGYLFGYQCLIKETCPIGYFQGSASEQSKLCEKCNVECLACVDTKDYCLECSKLASYQGKCYEKCPSGYYVQSKLSTFITNTTVTGCATCPSECLTCISSTICTSCIFSYSLFNTKCVQRCPPTYMQKFNTVQFALNTNYTVSQCSPCLYPCNSCFLYESLCQSCISGFYMYNSACLRSCPQGTYLDNLTQSCKDCPLPCKICIEKDRKIICQECDKGYYVKQGVCVDKCKEKFVDFEGKSCVEDCSGGYSVVHILTNMNFCTRQCQIPYLKDQKHKRCVTNCSSSEYTTAKYECQTYLEQISGLIPRLKPHLFVDEKAILKLYVEITREVEYMDTQPIQENLEIAIVDLYQSVNSQKAPKFSVSRMLQSSSSFSINFTLTSKTPSLLIFSIYPPISISYPSSLSLTFKSNSHLNIIDKVSKLPLQSSNTKLDLKQGQFYEVYDYSMITNNRFAYVGEIIMDFVLILSLVMLAFNRFSKLYHLLIFCQSLFMLACLDIPLPPNLYRFLQGFKYAHLYQFPNWFDPLELNQRYTNFTGRNFNKIESIFGDVAFLRVAGHFIGFYCIVIGMGLALYGVKSLPQGRNEYLKFMVRILSEKFKHIKWSHMVDVFISTFMLTISAFFFQTLNYSTTTAQQSLSITLSYLLMLPLLTFCILFTYRNYTLHLQSLNQPQLFMQHQYLHREQYICFYEGITSTHQSYKNYIIVARVLMYGFGTGVLWQWPGLCLGVWVISQVVAVVIYFNWKPFADDVQDYLYGVACIIHAVAMVLMIVINQSHKPQSSFYLPFSENHKKILIGYFIIVLLLIGTFILIIQMIISIIRGSLTPKKLEGQNEEYNQVRGSSPNSLNISPTVLSGPKRIEFEEKKEFLGYEIDEASVKKERKKVTIKEE